MASKIVQYIPIWFKVATNMHPRALKTAPGRLQVPFEPPKKAFKSPKAFKPIVVFNGFLHHRLFASDRLLRPQDGSRMAQEGPKRGPGGPQYHPKSAQGRHMSGPRGAQEGHFRAPTGGRVRASPHISSIAPRGLQSIKYGLKSAPRAPLEGHKEAPGRPKASKIAQ